MTTSLAPSEANGGAMVSVSVTASAWNVTGKGEVGGGSWEASTPSGTPLNGTPPSGATQVEFVVGASEGGSAGDIVNLATSPTAMSTEPGVTLELTGPRGSPNAQYPVTVNWYNSAGTWIGTGTVTLVAAIPAVG